MSAASTSDNTSLTMSDSFLHKGRKLISYALETDQRTPIWYIHGYH